MAGPGLFKGEAIAELLGITERRLQQLAKEGYIPKDARGEYPIVGSVQGYIRYLKELARGGRSNEHGRLARAQAIKVEMENARRRGELIYAVQAEETLKGLSSLLSRQLDAVAGRLTGELAGRSWDPAILRERLLDEHRAIREACAQYLEERADTLQSFENEREDLAPSTAEERGAMGGSESEASSIE